MDNSDCRVAHKPHRAPIRWILAVKFHTKRRGTLALARHHGNVPATVGVQFLHFVSLFNPPIARVGKDDVFLTVQQRVRLRDVMGIGCGGGDGVHQPRVGVHANVRLHAEVPLVALLGLVHLRVPLAVLVLGGAGRGDQGGVHHGAALEQQATGHQPGVDASQNLRRQLVLLQQVAKAQDGAFVGQAGEAGIQVCELAVQRDVVQRLFHGRVGVAKELLQQVNAQHGLQRKGRAPCLARWRVRRNEREQVRPWDDLIHLVQEHPLARALVSQLESALGKADLVHRCSTFEGLDQGTYADVL